MVVMAGAAMTAGSILACLAPMGRREPTRVEVVIWAVIAIATAMPNLVKPISAGMSE